MSKQISTKNKKKRRKILRVEKGDIVDSKSFHRLLAPYIRMRAYRVKRKKRGEKREKKERRRFSSNTRTLHPDKIDASSRGEGKRDEEKKSG